MRNYEEPYMEIIELKLDVITASGDEGLNNGGTGDGFGEDL